MPSRLPLAGLCFRRNSFGIGRLSTPLCFVKMPTFRHCFIEVIKTDTFGGGDGRRFCVAVGCVVGVILKLTEAR